MAGLGIYFSEEIADHLRSVMMARFGNIEPGGCEFMNALDSVAAGFGLERVWSPSSGWRWVPVEEK